jgi:hypothetical protein
VGYKNSCFDSNKSCIADLVSQPDRGAINPNLPDRNAPVAPTPPRFDPRAGAINPNLPGQNAPVAPASPTAPFKTVIDLNGRWTDGSTRRAVISAAYTYPYELTIDMSAYGRPAAKGVIVDDSTITVTFPDDKSYTGKLQPPNTIRWSNGSAWTKVAQ